jgi:ATP-dependent helicase/nuclease subunit B
MRQLIEAIGIGRDEVAVLGAATAPARTALLSEAMRPAATTERWAGARPEPAALDGLALLAARNEAEEALAIALALREAVEDGVQAALVTPDRALARRVAAELGRWGLEIDDSAGTPLAATPPAVLARLVADAALGNGEPLALLALAKHPLAAFGMRRPECRHAARALEIAALRGMRAAGGIGALADAVWEARRALSTPEGRFAHARKRLQHDDWRAASDLAKRLAGALLPLAGLAGEEASVAELTRRLIAALRLAGKDETGGDALLWQGAAGEALAALLAGLLDPEAEALTIGAAEYPAFLAAVMAGAVVTRPPTADPRIHLWGTLEARLQTAGLTVLGGLDEGTWPAETRTDAWLSRTMRAGIGLPAPERRTGLAAHDFVQAMGAPRVIVTRADKRGGSPTVASRWLQRLLAVAGADGAEALAGRGRKYLDWARALDRVKPEQVRPTDRPNPRPPVAARPRSLSITEIETWIRDPYAIYARRVLGLEPLDPIGKAPDAATRGNLVHEVLHRFAKAWSGPFDAAAEERLLAIGEEVFRPLREFPEVHALWWLRCQAIARWIVEWEAGRDGEIAERHAEISGVLEFGPESSLFRLRGRADRIDLRRDGRIEIIDYKTGQPPSAKQVLTFSPQLALEVAIARAGGFGETFAGRKVAALAWIGLGKVGRGDPFASAVDRAQNLSADEIGRTALAQLKALVAAYDRLKQGYVSEARPMFERRFEGPYEHLARVREWRLGDGAGEE